MSVVTILIVLIAAIFCFRISKKNSTLKEFWQKTSKEALFLRTQLSKKENELSSALNKVALLQKSNQDLEKENEDKNTTILGMEKNEATSLSYFKNEIKRLTLNITNYKEQIDVMGEQLKAADKERSLALKELASFKDKTSTMSPIAQKDLDTLQSKVVSLTNENLALQKKIQTLETDTIEKMREEQKQFESDILKLKKNLINSSFLYKGMRGLKEMAEERNRNLEVAVRTLSGWVLKQKNIEFDEDSTSPIGPILGEALESIGSSLIEEETAVDLQE